MLAVLEATLSPDERARAQTRAGELDRRRFIADHGWRRQLLGRRLGCAPGAVGYALGDHGKPVVVGGRACFSASRAQDTALYAVSDDVPVGVDVEPVDPGRDLDALARRTLSAAERAIWDALPVTERAHALYACWTRKEAHGKALGTGIVFPLSSVDAWTGDGRPTRVGEIVVTDVALADANLVGAVAARVTPGVELSLPRAPEPLTM